MSNTLDSFKQDMNHSLLRQVRVLVQQINGVAQGKRVEGSPTTLNLGGTSNQGNQAALANVSQPNPRVNLNLQQPFYQTMAYERNVHPMGSDIPHGPMPDTFSLECPLLTCLQRAR
jgi:hypothetical protein